MLHEKEKIKEKKEKIYVRLANRSVLEKVEFKWPKNSLTLKSHNSGTKRPIKPRIEANLTGPPDGPDKSIFELFTASENAQQAKQKSLLC